ncbi:MAG: methylmalonyl Co-A mutase-associated GTPase MeaB, partial [Melioribacteraceae bacterium]|nr:methylmalonyl Co-A mutase-associated GTPase MeaB [Melioribacteraceae bacterium]
NYLKQLHKKTGKAYRIGITGPPGAGKSTITNQITKLFLAEKKSVAIIAVDPTSPFSGGALLGDRVRMNEIGLNENVFIRSMATRGSLGGLSRKAIDTADIFDAAGYDYIIIETVGVGQSELDIVQAADTTVVTLVPESGDAIQAMKAGLMEIADFFILNKCDRPGSDNAFMSLQTILSLKDHKNKDWAPTIIKCTATENEGISEIITEINKHRNYLNTSSTINRKRAENIKIRVKEIIANNLELVIWNSENKKKLNSSVDEVLSGTISPYNLAEDILNNFINRNEIKK